MEAVDYLVDQHYKIKQPSKDQVLSAVDISKSIYHSIKNHKPTITEIKRIERCNEIERLFKKFNEIYGSPKILAELVKLYGEDYTSKRTVAIDMQRLGLKSITVPNFKGCSSKEQQLPFNIPMVNYIKYDKPGTCFTHILTDITYIYTQSEGWGYLLTFMDMYSRKILVWDLCNEMTATWVTNIADKLIKNYPSIAFIHSDSGSQYTSKVYLECLLTNGVSPSFSSKGYPYHNAWIENFHAQLKKNIFIGELSKM